MYNETFILNATNVTLLTPYAPVDTPRDVTRYCCIFIVTTFNLWAGKNIFIDTKSTNSEWVTMIKFYVVLATIATLYNLIYRFTINPNDCALSDIFEEYLIVIARIPLILFYILRLFKFQQYKLYIIIFCIIITNIFMSTIWIVVFPMNVKTKQSLWNGWYCSNTPQIGKEIWLYLYWIFDGLIAFILLILFMWKLQCCKRQRKSSKSNLKYEFRCNATMWTILSIISTFAFLFPSYLDTNNFFLTVLRWFYPLDYGINVLCLFNVVRKVKIEGGLQQKQHNKENKNSTENHRNEVEIVEIGIESNVENNKIESKNESNNTITSVGKQNKTVNLEKMESTIENETSLFMNSHVDSHKQTRTSI